MHVLRHLFTVVGILLVLFLFGCGGKSTNSTTTTEAKAWAQGVCTAVADFRTKAQDAGDTVRSSGLSRTALETAAATVRDAADELVTKIQALGTPGTSGGKEIRQALDTLTQQLDADAKAIADATKGAATRSSIATATQTLAKARQQVETAADTIRSADAKGELKAAFDDAPACADLRA